VYVAGGPNDVSTRQGSASLTRSWYPRMSCAARSAAGCAPTTHPTCLLIAEVVSPSSGGERTERVQKVEEYAKAGIPLWP
jgi:Uma2 family endonuclease